MESLKSGKKFEPKKECYVTLIINVKEEESRKVIEKKCPEKKKNFEILFHETLVLWEPGMNAF